jgi:nuclear pore complex protein Nup93
VFIEDKGAAPLINMARLIRGYIREYSFREPALALHYLYLFQDEAQRHAAIRDLVIESEDFDTIVGEMQPDGTRKEGLLARFVTPAQWKDIVSLAAQSCEENGKYDAAIKLYDISQVRLPIQLPQKKKKKKKKKGEQHRF